MPYCGKYELFDNTRTKNGMLCLQSLKTRDITSYYAFIENDIHIHTTDLKFKYSDLVFLDILIRLSLEIELTNDHNISVIQVRLKELIAIIEHDIFLRNACYQLLWKLQSRKEDEIIIDLDIRDLLKDALKDSNYGHLIEEFDNSLLSDFDPTISIIANDPFTWIIPDLKKISLFSYVPIYRENNRIR